MTQRFISVETNQAQLVPLDTREDRVFTQRDTGSVSAKMKLNQDQIPEKTRLLTETKRNMVEVQSNQIANQRKNLSSTETERNRLKKKEKQVSVEMKTKQQKDESCPRSEPNQLQEPLETKPAICKHLNL